MEKKWYQYEYENKEYLHNKTLIYKKFVFENDEHDHCELCWAKFSNHQSDNHFGYYEKKSNSIICIDCFEELKDLFQWKVDNT